MLCIGFPKCRTVFSECHFSLLNLYFSSLKFYFSFLKYYFRFPFSLCRIFQLKQYHVFHMMSMREHIHRLDSFYFVFCVEQL